MNTTMLGHVGSSLDFSQVAPASVITGAIAPVSFIPPSRQWDAENIIVGVTACDWLTITTYDAALFRWAVGLLGHLTSDEGRKAGKWMQYEGSKGAHYFYGVADQRRPGSGEVATHYALWVSGSFAHVFLSYAIEQVDGVSLLRGFKCTRFDVQRTHSDLLSVDLRATLDYLLDDETKWLGRGKRPYLHIWANEEHLDTLYIGKRKETNRFQRMYIKPIGSKNRFRHEVEYKQELAASIWDKVLSEGLSVLSAVLMGELSVIPLPPEFQPFIDGFSVTPDRLKIVRVESDLATKARWAAKILRSTVRRLLACGVRDVREYIAGVIEEVYLGDELARYPGPARQVSDFLPALT